MFWQKKKEDDPDLRIKDSFSKEKIVSTLQQYKYICYISIIFLI